MYDSDKSVYFSSQEFAQRQECVLRYMHDESIDALVVSRNEDCYWLYGLDNMGWTIFNAGIIFADGRISQVCRSADLGNVNYSALCDEIFVLEEAGGGAGGDRAGLLLDVLSSHCGAGSRIALQDSTFGMLPDLYNEVVDRGRDSFHFVGDGNIIRQLRMIKSPQELEYVRQSGRIVSSVTRATLDTVRAGVPEDVLAGVFYGEVCRLGGDLPASLVPMGSGKRAILGRSATARGTVGENDQVTFELGAGYRHYQTASMITATTGPQVSDAHRVMHEACVSALSAVQAKIRPGETLGDVYGAHLRALEGAGFGDHVLNACGYTMSAMWPPTWMDRPMILRDSPVVIAEGMVLFTHMVLSNWGSWEMMSLGETVIVTDGEPEIVASVPHDLVCR